MDGAYESDRSAWLYGLVDFNHACAPSSTPGRSMPLFVIFVWFFLFMAQLYKFEA